MLFNSLIFLIFGSFFFILWPFFRRRRNPRWIFLIASSFFFYGWWDWRYLILIILSGLIDFNAGLAIQRRPSRKRIYLISSIAGNLGFLGLFKYSRFFAENIDILLGTLQVPIRLAPLIPEFMTIVPVGISFYTFQSMSYTIDIYRGHFTATRNIFHFFAYLSLFPQLVAGPIVRARELMPQLKMNVRASATQQRDGLYLIVHGYFKKVVIADSLAPIVNAAFSAPTLETSSLFWWIIVSMFALQIYCDFSGYSDIARGLAKWMGYDFCLNFNHPYIAKSFREFWNRWHISLSSWFKDYVYLPLGGSRNGSAKTYRNIWITMILSGLWHGAAWTFIAWAICHSFFVSIERISRWPARVKNLPCGGIFASLIVLTQVWIAWVFFRAENLNQAIDIIRRMFSFDISMFYVVDYSLFAKAFFLACLWAGRELYIGWKGPTLNLIPSRFIPIANEARLIIMIAACIYLRGPGSTFIYFQF